MQEYSDHELVRKVLESSKDDEVIEHGEVMERNIVRSEKIDPEKFDYVWAMYLKKLIRTKIERNPGFKGLLTQEIPPEAELQRMEKFLKSEGIL